MQSERQVLRHDRMADLLAQLGLVAHRSMREAAVPLGAGAAYYVGCLAGFALRFPSSGISFLWPPNAILLTALLIVAPASWPVVLASTFVGHAFAHAGDGIPTVAWSVQYFGNASQALLAAWIIRRFGSAELFADFRRVLVFIVGACIVAPAIASLAPAFAYVSLGWASDFLAAWRARVVSNMTATLTIAPSLLVLWSFVQKRRVVRPQRVGEFAALLAALVATPFFLSYSARTDLLGLSIVLYAMTPFLLWATMRFGGAGLSLALSMILLIISTTATDMSPIARGVPADAVVSVQLLLTANAVPLMLLAGLLEQNRASHRSLADVERQNRAILRALPDTTLLHTRDGVVLQAYPRSIDDAVTENRGSASDLLPPAETHTTRALELSAAADEPCVTEYTQVVDDSARRYEARTIAVDQERMLTIVRDMTDRWRSEQALRETQHRYALATGVGIIGVWDYDVKTGTVHIEGTLKAALGYAQDEIGDTMADWQLVIFEGDREEVRARLSSLIDGDAQSFEAEFRLTHKDGSLRWVNSKAAVTDWVDGKTSRVIGTYEDVTERKAAARALGQANDTLVRMGRIAAIGEVTASIGHELHQPLTAISANVTACLSSIDSDPADEIRETLNDVLRESQRAGEIIERTRRLFANHPTQPISLNVNDVVGEVVKILTPRLRELHVRLALTLEPELPEVYADVVQMQQVLFNLIVNGADAMSSNTGEPRVMHLSTRRGKRHVVVSVRDSGPGLDRAQLRRVFEPFYTTKPGGIGMGLAISHSILRSHGGTLWGVANADRGSTFRFKIPIRRAVSHQLEVSLE